MLERESAIKEIEKLLNTSYPCLTDNRREALKTAIITMKTKSEMYSCETACGYPVEELIVVAHALRNSNVSNMDLHDFVTSASSAWDFAINFFYESYYESAQKISNGLTRQGKLFGERRNDGI